MPLNAFTPCLGFDQSFDGLASSLESSERAARVARILRTGGRPAESAAIRQDLRARLQLSEPQPDLVTESSDGTLKFRFSGEHGAYETVLIPSIRRSTVCVSTQVGCRRGCVFCATGTMGAPNNLRTHEIMAQVWFAAREATRRQLPRLRNIVFMGMGEPFDNLDRVERALCLLTDGRMWGFAPSHVTVSTVGISPRAIARAQHFPARLAWSLHAAEDALRAQLVESQRFPVRELRDAFARLGRTLFVEITLISELNDREPHAQAVADLFAEFPSEVRFNLLPVNPSEATARRFQPASADRVRAFARVLTEAGHRVMVRRPRGADRASACGQLVALPSPSIARTGRAVT